MSRLPELCRPFAPRLCRGFPGSLHPRDTSSALKHFGVHVLNVQLPSSSSCDLGMTPRVLCACGDHLSLPNTEVVSLWMLLQMPPVKALLDLFATTSLPQRPCRAQLQDFGVLSPLFLTDVHPFAEVALSWPLSPELQVLTHSETSE